MFKKWLLPVVVAFAALAWTSPASADTILFDPDGPGGVLTAHPVDNFDWAVGNALAIFPVGTNTSTLAVGQTFQLLYQANLGQATLAGGTVQFTQTDAGVIQTSPLATAAVFYTVAATFNETVLTKTVNPSGTIDYTFGFSATPPNTFTIYENTTGTGNNLTGICFVCGNAVLSGSISPIGYTSEFLGTTTAPPFGNLDQAGANNYPNQFTVAGSGSFNINVNVTSVNTGIFSGLAPGSIITFGNFNGNATTPFTEVDPSACMHGTAVPCVGGVPDAVAVGAINGLTNNLFAQQVDANSSFITTTSAIPEPASLTLLGFGLVGAAVARRRQAKKNQK